MILMHLMRLESFLINIEVIFYSKKQRELEKNFIKKRLSIIFLKEKEQEGSLTNKQKNALKSIDRYLKKLNNDLKKLEKYEYNLTYGLDYLLNQQKPRALLMVVMFYMKVKEIKIIC